MGTTRIQARTPSDARRDDRPQHLPPNEATRVLFALLEGDRHGYGIVKEIEESSGGTVTMDPSNLYRSVKRLIRIDLLEEADLGKAPHSDEKRRHYRITPLGTRVVVAEAERLAQLTAVARERRVIAR